MVHIGARNVFQPKVTDRSVDFERVAVSLGQGGIVLLQRAVLRGGLGVLLGVEEGIRVLLAFSGRERDVECGELRAGVCRVVAGWVSKVDRPVQARRCGGVTACLVGPRKRGAYIQVRGFRVCGKRLQHPHGVAGVVVRQVGVRQEHRRLRDEERIRELVTEVCQRRNGIARPPGRDRRLRPQEGGVVRQGIPGTRGGPESSFRVAEAMIQGKGMPYRQVGGSSRFPGVRGGIRQNAAVGRARARRDELLGHRPEHGGGNKRTAQVAAFRRGMFHDGMADWDATQAMFSTAGSSGLQSATTSTRGRGVRRNPVQRGSALGANGPVMVAGCRARLF